MDIEQALLDLMALAEQRLTVEQAWRAHRRWQELGAALTDADGELDAGLRDVLAPLYIYTGQRLLRAIDDAENERARGALIDIEHALRDVLTGFDEPGLDAVRARALADRLDALARDLAKIDRDLPDRDALSNLYDYAEAKSRRACELAAPTPEESAIPA